MIGKKNSYKAILLDLDGTLLDLDIDKFIAAYINALAQRFNKHLSREEFIRHLFGATTVMVDNKNPAKINETVFYEEFCFRIGQNYSDIKPIIDAFYKEDFPGLSCWGKEHPHAQNVIDMAKKKKIELVLATNPIFPSTAILQRLSWSGLSESEFKFITSMENMHFCKPNPDYYLEIAKKINCPPEDCLMAGNDTLEDLIAAEAGMETYLVEDFILQRGEEKPVCSYRGGLSDLAEFISNLP